MSTKQPTLAAATFTAMLLLSCNMSTGVSTTTTDETTAPAAAPHVVAPPAKLDLRAGDIESSGRPPSSEMVAKTNALAARLGSAIGQDQVRVAFVSCEQAPCSARLSSPTLEALQQAIDAVGRDQQGQIEATTRERLDPYMGRSFEADVTLAEDPAP